MKKYLLIAALFSLIAVFACDDTPDDEATAQCKSDCSARYEPQLKYCSEKYAADSDERDDCERDASEKMAECIKDCE